MIAIAEPKQLGRQPLDGTFLLQRARIFRKDLEHAEWEMLEKLLSEPIEFMDNPLFHDPISERQILDSFDDPTGPGASAATEVLCDPFAKSDGEATAFKPLTTDQETCLFTQMNYARYRIYQTVRDCEDSMPTTDMLGQLVHWRQTELAIRSRITEANIPLVLAMVKRAKMTGVDFAEMVSEGNIALLRSVAKFDVSRGFKFSTYACRAILKGFSRIAMKAMTYHRYFPVSLESGYEKGTYLDDCRRGVNDHCLERVRGLLADNDAEGVLTDVEKQVLRARFGISNGQTMEADEQMTLEEVGIILGITKERVRQIQNKGLRKLRDALDACVLSS